MTAFQKVLLNANVSWWDIIHVVVPWHMADVPLDVYFLLYSPVKWWIMTICCVFTLQTFSSDNTLEVGCSNCFQEDIMSYCCVPGVYYQCKYVETWYPTRCPSGFSLSSLCFILIRKLWNDNDFSYSLFIWLDLEHSSASFQFPTSSMTSEKNGRCVNMAWIYTEDLDIEPKDGAHSVQL